MSAVMTAVAGFYSYPEGDPLALPVGVAGTLAAFLLWRFAF